MKKWILLVAIGCLLAGHVSIAKADEVTELKKQMAEQAELLRQMQQKLDQIEAQQAQQNEKMEEQVAEEVAQAVEETQIEALPEGFKWIENVSLYGDFRYRYEYIDAEGDSSDRHRNRIRARVGLKGKINDEMSYNVRIASGSSDPVSTNQTLDGGFSSKNLWLDRAYLQWEPASMEGWTLLFGKMSNPFFKPGKCQLIWDDDLNPEGVAAQYTTNLNETTGLFVNAGGMWVEESSSNADASLWGIQGGLKHAFDHGDKLTWGGSYYKYGNVKDSKTFYDVQDGFGNTTYTDLDGDEAYLYDYELAELFAEYGTKLSDTPASFYSDYVLNTVSGVSEDTGWLIGTTLGKAKNPGTWGLGYEYRDLENDAVVGVFTDSDFIGGGTGGKGHKFSAAYALAKNATLAATYFMSERDADGDGNINDDYDRFQLDLKVKF